MSHRLTIAAAAAAALFLTAAEAPAQTTGETGAAATPAQPPDVSGIVIRRPSSAVVRPEDYRIPVPVTEGEDLEEDEELAEDDAVDPEIARDIVVRDAPDAGVAPVPAVPNTTSADVNDPGVRIRIGQ